MMTDEHLVIYRRAHALLSQFLIPGHDAEHLTLLLSLRPQPSDYARVFVASVVELAQATYSAMWASPQPLKPAPDQTLVELQVATAQELLDGTGAASEFPGGYAGIAHLLRPERYWLCFRFGAPGQRGSIFYDGLVAIDDRLIWLPKPWRCLRPQPPPAFSIASHFDD